MEKVTLPRRDWILLPMLSLLTIVFMAVSTELLARRMFGQSATIVENCLHMPDPAKGVHGIPNAVCWVKDRETPPIEYRFNSCGHRTDIECGPGRPGIYRIVAIGSSVVMGNLVQQEDALTTRLPIEISRRSGREVDLYNEGMVSQLPQVAALRFEEVLAAKPDMVLWVLMPYDIAHVLIDPAAMLASPPQGGFLARWWLRITEMLTQKSIREWRMMSGNMCQSDL